MAFLCRWPRTPVLDCEKGRAFCTIVPDTADRAVQVWLKGNDAPLVEPGRHVRLQFEGWPPFSSLDGHRSQLEHSGEPWSRWIPLMTVRASFEFWFCRIRRMFHGRDDRFLRQGVRTNGWVLLDTVPLWFEVWRILNGFPPTVDVDEPGKSGNPAKGLKTNLRA